MKKSRKTKRALIPSLLAVILCVAMLVGTTFAWFTDTASTSVNKIEAGTLDVKLEMATEWDDGSVTTWSDAEGKTLSFRKAAAAEGEAVLWEPGATYKLPEFRIVNNGNLALKYKVLFAAVDTSTADLALAKVLDVYMTVGSGTQQNVGTLAQVLADSQTTADINADGYAKGKLEKNNDSDEIAIELKMQETAGNEYQGMTIGGIAVTVLAAQYTSEHDSEGNQYDAGATYSGYEAPLYGETTVSATSTDITVGDSSSVNVNKVTTRATIDIKETVDRTETVVASATIPEGTYLDAGETTVTLSVIPTTKVNEGTATAVKTNQAAKSYEIKMDGVSEHNTTEITVTFYTDTGLSGVKVYHSGSEMNSSKYDYDSDTGKVTIRSATFSPFDIVYTIPGTVIPVNASNIQDYLDGKYGSIDGATLVLAAGEYGNLELGRATKYAGSNTQYFNTAEGFNGTPVTLEELKNNHTNRYYIRSMSNVTFKAATNAEVKIAGIEMTSGGRNGTSGIPCTDYVLDLTKEEGIYYLAQKVYNIAFEGITFTAKCNILGDGDATVINGFTFEDCKFNINNTAKDNQAIIYGYNNATMPFKVSNLVVDHCEFTTCYQGVYTRNVYGVTVNNCKFNTTGHNAIAIQDDVGDGNTFSFGAVVITNNTFTNIGDRIIRFGHVGADTKITITGNTATNSGSTDDNPPEVIKATSLAEGITYNISGNNWGTKNGVATVVYNEELRDK